MSIEKTQETIANIRQQIAALKEVEDVFMLAELYYDVRDLFTRYTQYSPLTLTISPTASLKKEDMFNFEIHIGYKVGDEFKVNTGLLFHRLEANGWKYQCPEYLKEFKAVINTFCREEVKSIKLNTETTVEEFLHQVNPKFVSIYSHQCLQRDLPVQEKVTTAKVKI